jgi:kinesin family protein C2/C3
MEATSLVRSVMAGTNVTIFAYGQTGSGKTHTMQYLNHKALEDLFRHQREDEEDSTRRYRFKIQMLEIYNEQVNDMLEPSNKNLKVHHLSFRNEESMTRVPDARIVAVETIEDVQKILEHGSSNRRVGATKMNDRSSRSHLMFTVMVERMEENGEVKRGRLHLIDLAGSERLNRSGAEGERATEAKAINLSLSTLGRVLAGIAANQRHISFRDSKITQLLEDSLTGGHGKSKCMMFMHVAPEAPSGQETRSTLEFGKSVVENVVVSG